MAWIIRGRLYINKGSAISRRIKGHFHMGIGNKPWIRGVFTLGFSWLSKAKVKGLIKDRICW